MYSIRNTPEVSSGALFLDRDGVINSRVAGGYVLTPAELKFNRYFLNAFAQFTPRIGRPVVIITNQACVRKGLIDAAGLALLMQLVSDELEQHGIIVSAWFACPHTDVDACNCRKPKPGLLLESADRLRIDLSVSAFVGDSVSDLAAGAAAGCPSYRVDPHDPQTFFSARIAAEESLR